MALEVAARGWFRSRPQTRSLVAAKCRGRRCHPIRSPTRTCSTAGTCHRSVETERRCTPGGDRSRRSRYRGSTLYTRHLGRRRHTRRRRQRCKCWCRDSAGGDRSRRSRYRRSTMYTRPPDRRRHTRRRRHSCKSRCRADRWNLPEGEDRSRRSRYRGSTNHPRHPGRRRRRRRRRQRCKCRCRLLAGEDRSRRSRYRGSNLYIRHPDPRRRTWRRSHSCKYWCKVLLEWRAPEGRRTGRHTSQAYHLLHRLRARWRRRIPPLRSCCSWAPRRYSCLE